MSEPHSDAPAARVKVICSACGVPAVPKTDGTCPSCQAVYVAETILIPEAPPLEDRNDQARRGASFMKPGLWVSGLSCIAVGLLLNARLLDEFDLRTDAEISGAIGAAVGNLAFIVVGLFLILVGLVRNWEKQTVRPALTTMTFEPRNLTRHPEFVRFEDEQGLEYEVYGEEDRLAIAFEVAEAIATIRKQSETLLYDFMKHKGTFFPGFVRVFATPEEDGGGFRIRYFFTEENDPHEFGYTYFDVILAVRAPPSPRFWPIKLVVGFW